ncbi:UNVERIFIED_ORG: AraC-like DNA-binding protein [Paraburkholderia sediminicola]|nr:AraC-like DNA-binding protein [Paraburkholderia sediminicola]
MPHSSKYREKQQPLERIVMMRAGLGATARIYQHAELTSHRITADAAILIRVEQGCKLIRWSGGQVLAEAGDAVALAPGVVFDITNRLSREGQYEAFWVVWDASLIRAFAVDSTAQPIEAAHLLRQVQPQVRMSYDAALSCLSDPYSFPEAIARHKLNELLLWIEQSGVRFSLPDETSIRLRVRKLIGLEMSRRWTSVEVAHALGVSEATLRRYLAEEGVGFRELLQDVRMTHALTLLQSTNNSVLDVGLAVGYDSASRFAVRFRERFGFSPSAVRGQKRGRHSMPTFRPPVSLGL